MKTRKKTLQEHLDDFQTAVIGQREALLKGDWRTGNPLAKKYDAAFRKIIEYGEEGRNALLALTEHPNVSVAEMAAVYSLKYNPEQCLNVLRRLSSEPGLIGFGAQQAIQRWEEGSWQLE
ncbi:MAG: hypothetical protein HC853_00885 [Anaerolineae bacterium]|nr:hypothetical protein [Anaerolineae bacterium]